MLTSMRHTLSELQAKISQQDEHEQQCFGLQLSTGYGVMDSAPNGVAGGMNLPLAAGRWAGMNASTLHAEMHAHMDNIARFAVSCCAQPPHDVVFGRISCLGTCEDLSLCIGVCGFTPFRATHSRLFDATGSAWHLRLHSR